MILSIFFNVDPITHAVYGIEHQLLSKPGWKNKKKYVKSHKSSIRQTKQSVLRQARQHTKFKFLGKTNWQDAILVRQNQIEYFYGEGRLTTPRASTLQIVTYGTKGSSKSFNIYNAITCVYPLSPSECMYGMFLRQYLSWATLR